MSPVLLPQAPPNLTLEPDDAQHEGAAVGGQEAGWRALLDAGINDWGARMGCLPAMTVMVTHL